MPMTTVGLIRVFAMGIREAAGIEAAGGRAVLLEPAPGVRQDALHMGGESIRRG